VTRRILITTAGAVIIGFIASLVLATHASAAVADLASPSPGTLGVAPQPPGATPGLPPADVADLIGGGFWLADGFNPGGLARLRRRGSTMDRWQRTSRRGPTANTSTANTTAANTSAANTLAAHTPAAHTPAGKTTVARRVVSREQVVLAGCHYFLRHATLDMDDLAVQMSISRATLYRVVHGRDRLLADVLWRLAENALWRARKERTEYGVEGVLEVGRRFSAHLLDTRPFRTFLLREPDAAARVLLTATGGVHHRAVQAQKDIFLDATPPGLVWLTGDLDSLAYLLVRIFESTFYADLLASRQPDRELAERAIRAVLSSTP
jgi:hypothetical protein